MLLLLVVVVARNPNYEPLRALMLQDLYRVMRRVPSGSLQEQREWLSSAIADLVLVHGSNFASIAATELEVARMGRGEMGLPMVVAAAAGKEQVDAAVGWALSMDDFQVALTGATLRLGQAPARKTIVASALAAGRGFCRVVASDACPWCLMLASRGAVYESAESAGVSGQGRVRPEAKQNPGESFHDHCKCEVIEVRSAKDLPEFNIRLQDEWNKNVKGKPGDLFGVWREWLKKNPISVPAAA